MEDKLIVVGVDEKGYGKVYKQVMRDRDLPLTAKALYAYFCSYTGSGTTSFPSRDKIMEDLHLAKNTFTKYLNCLLETNYLARHRTAAGNVYEILLTVKSKDGRTVEIKSEGYGTVPKFAMLDARLTVTAKAIYAYLCSYAGAGNLAYPKRSTILHELGISSQKYYQHYKLLVELGYVTPTQETGRNGQFSSSTYVLNEILGIDPRIDPEEIRKSTSVSRKNTPCRKNHYTEESTDSTDFSTAMSQKSLHGGEAMSQKSLHGPMSQKSVHGYLRHPINNNNLHNKQILSSNEDRDRISNIRARAREVSEIPHPATPKEAVMELIQYERIWNGCQGTLVLKKILNPGLTQEEETAYLDGCRKIVNEVVRQLVSLLYGKSDYVKVGAQAYERTALRLKLEAAIGRNPQVLFEMVTQMADNLSNIRILPSYVRKSIMNLVA